MRKALSLLALLLLPACSDDGVAVLTETPPLEANAEPLFSTLYSNIREPRRLVITDEETWARLWAEMLPSNGGAATPPTVDFRVENVLVAAMGERRGGGFTIQITEVAREGSSLRAAVSSTIPVSACTGADVISTPLDAVRIPKSADVVQFSERTILLNCE